MLYAPDQTAWRSTSNGYTLRKYNILPMFQPLLPTTNVYMFQKYNLWIYHPSILSTMGNSNPKIQHNLSKFLSILFSNHLHTHLSQSSHGTKHVRLQSIPRLNSRYPLRPPSSTRWINVSLATTTILSDQQYVLKPSVL